MSLLNVIIPFGSFLILLAVIELIRKGRLKERYALLWLVSSLILFITSLSRDLLEYVSGLVGIHYAPSLLFLVAFGFLVIINLHFSTVLSSLAEKNKHLAQEIALLKAEMKKK